MQGHTHTRAHARKGLSGSYRNIIGGLIRPDFHGGHEYLAGLIKVFAHYTVPSPAKDFWIGSVTVVY